MFTAALAAYPAIERSSRIGPIARSTDRLNTAELSALLAAGILACMAVAFVEPGLRVPGSAILRAALPMVCGIALVPRRMAGSVMSAGAAVASVAFSAIGAAAIPAPAIAGMLALGPAIDLTMGLGAASGWRLYLRFGLACAAANAIAFAVRFGARWFEVDAATPHMLGRIGPGVFLSFALCGLIAGLLSAAVWFRASARDA